MGAVQVLHELIDLNVHNYCLKYCSFPHYIIPFPTFHILKKEDFKNIHLKICVYVYRVFLEVIHEGVF
jgi:hypothetical protein